MKGLKQNILEFDIISTGNPRTLVFADGSVYMGEPERPLLEVLMPGYNKYLLINVEPKVLNTFNSETLGFNHAVNAVGLLELPDGIWQLKYKICPYQYVYLNKSILRTTLLEIRLAEVYDKIDMQSLSDTEKKEFDKTFTDIHILLESGKLIAGRNPKKAYDNYRLAERLIRKISDKLCKNCK